MQKKSTMAYVLAALMLSTAVIYFVAAAGESAEAGEGVVRILIMMRLSIPQQDKKSLRKVAKRERRQKKKAVLLHR